MLVVRLNGDHRFFTILLPVAGLGMGTGGLGLGITLPFSFVFSMSVLCPFFLLLVVHLHGDRRFFTILLPVAGLREGVTGE